MTTLHIIEVPLQSLRASEQPRPLITADVDRMAASLREVGLISPIRIRKAGDGWQIVAGHHRVAAARAIGWESINAIVTEAGENLQAELIEIDENLCRSELSPAQRTAAIKRRKQIWEALHPVEMGGTTCPTHPETDSMGRKKSPQQEKAFAADTAAVSGESKRDVNRHLARAEAIGDDIERVAGTSLDKGVELDALAKLPEPERKELIDRAEAGEKVSARNPKQPKQAKQPEPELEEYFGPSDEEIAEAEAHARESVDALMKLAESDDALAAAIEENIRLRAQIDVLESVRDGYMNQCNELRSRLRARDRQIAALERKIKEVA